MKPTRFKTAAALREATSGKEGCTLHVAEDVWAELAGCKGCKKAATGRFNGLDVVVVSLPPGTYIIKEQGCRSTPSSATSAT